MRECLKVSGILNIVLSCFYLLFSIFGGVITFSCFIYLLTTGILFLNYSGLEDIRDKYSSILVLSIICLPISFISGLINIISVININDNKSRAPNIDPETKRIDVLVKIGLGLITLAGIIFISSDWNEFSSFLVLLFLFILTIVFYLLYLLFTIKIKLNSSSKLYYVLSNIFVLLIFLAVGHYNLLGDYFSINGEGSSLFYFVFWVITSLLTFNLKKITLSDVRLYFVMIFSTLGIYNLLLFFNFNTMQSLVLINVLVLFFKYVSKNKYISNYVDILVKLFIVFAGLCLFDGYSISLLIIIIINIIVINYLNIKNNSILYEISTPIITIFYSSVIIGLLFNNYDYKFSDYILVVVSFFSIIYILEMCIKYFSSKVLTKRVFVIIYNSLFFIFSIISLFLEEYVLLFIIIIRIIMLFSYYYYEYRYNIKDIEYYIIPFNFSVLFLCILVYLNNFIIIDSNIIMLSIMLLLSFYYIYIKNRVLNFISYVLICILNIINVFVSIFNDNVMIVSLCLISTLLPFILQLLKDKKQYNILSYIYLLCSSFIILCNGVYDGYIGIILNMILYLMLFIIFYNKEKYNKYLLLFIGLPLLRLVNNIGLEFDYVCLFVNIILLYILFIIIYKFINNFGSRKIIFIVFSSIIFLFILFNSNYIFGIYIGLISLILILYSSIKDNYKSIFNYGLILFIINILYRLKSIWYKIPLWGYLLFAGLTIITFATIKEFKKTSKK